MLRAFDTLVSHRCQFVCRSNKLLTCTPCYQLNYLNHKDITNTKNHKEVLLLLQEKIFIIKQIINHNS